MKDIWMRAPDAPVILRLKELVAKPGKTEELQQKLAHYVVPLLESTQGFQGFMTIVSQEEPRLVGLITFWVPGSEAEFLRWEKNLVLSDPVLETVEFCPKARSFIVPMSS